MAARRRRNRWRHARGFGAYVAATMEQRHAVGSVYRNADGPYCAQCAFPVVEIKEA